jgi:hypothetical protein
MFGGGRRTVLIVGQPFTTNPFGLQGLAEIRTPPPSSPPDTTGTLIVSTGTRVNWVFELFYGLVAEGMFAPANHNFTGCNKFLVTVDSADTGFFILMNVYTNSLTKFSKVQVFIPPSLPSAPVASRTYEIPFSSFTSGSPDDANWSDVDFINVGFRAGNGLGGDDFSILSIKAVP